MKKLFLFLGLCCLSHAVYADDFPLRTIYPDVIPISTAELSQEFENVVIIDVRSAFEYNIIRIHPSHHISISTLGFIPQLKKTVPDKHARIVFYCNGITCAKSYKACVKAAAEGYRNVFVYDAGVFEWAKTNPDKAVLLGTNPVAPDAIISEREFEKRLLEKHVFEQRAQSEDAFLIDARDMIQRRQTPDFSTSARSIPFDRLASLLRNDDRFLRKVDGKTLYIMDAVGEQVRWLQYLLEEKGVEYFFLKDGVWSYYGAAGASQSAVCDTCESETFRCSFFCNKRRAAF